MNRLQAIFFEVYEHLPLQEPGNRSCAARALDLCRGLRASTKSLDLGCGVGGQTLQLAELTSGSIVAMDSHPPSIERLRATVAGRGLADRTAIYRRETYHHVGEKKIHHHCRGDCSGRCRRSLLRFFQQ